MVSSDVLEELNCQTRPAAVKGCNPRGAHSSACTFGRRNERQIATETRCAEPAMPAAADSLAAEFAPRQICNMKSVYGQFRTRCRRRIFQPDAPFLGRLAQGRKRRRCGRSEPGAAADESRRPFRLTQRIAPGYCWEVPPESAWIDVRCYDLAQGGFSFFLDEKPTFERLVAMFRSAEPIYVAAGQPLAASVGRRLGRHSRARHPSAGACRPSADGIEVPRRLPVPAAVHALTRCLLPRRSAVYNRVRGWGFRSVSGRFALRIVPCCGSFS